MKVALPILALVALTGIGLAPAELQAPQRLLLAFSSYRERPRHPNIFLYEHDGKSTGKVVGSIATPRAVASADAHPSLSSTGRYCAFTHEKENNIGQVFTWDVQEQKPIDMPNLNNSPNAQMGPSISGDGSLIAFSAWNRPGGPGQGWHVFLYDIRTQKLLDLPDLNSTNFEDRLPAISGDGRYLAFASNRREGAGLTDIYLYDRSKSQVVTIDGLNSAHMDADPTLNGDGSLLAFASDRPGGLGGRDIYLFDRSSGKLLPLPGLNSVGQEYSPALSADGRFLVFVSDRFGGEGERDIYLYDRQAQAILPTPGLNSPRDDFDPCIVVLPGS